MGLVLLVSFYILAVFGIFYVAYRAWKKADIQEKFSRAEEVEENFEAVQKFEGKHKDLSKKSKTVRSFKNKTF